MSVARLIGERADRARENAAKAAAGKKRSFLTPVRSMDTARRFCECERPIIGPESECWKCGRVVLESAE